MDQKTLFNSMRGGFGSPKLPVGVYNSKEEFVTLDNLPKNLQQGKEIATARLLPDSVVTPTREDLVSIDKFEIIETNGYPAEGLKVWNRFVFYWICANDSLDSLKLLNTEGINQADIKCGLVNCCGAGNLEIVKYLIVTFKITKIEYIDEALTGACDSGCLDVVKYLVETFDLSKDDITHKHLIYASAGGYFDIMDYLVDNFEVTNNKNFGMYALSATCESGPLEMLKYLVKNFKIERDYVILCDPLALACKENKVENLRYVIETFDLASERKLMNHCLDEAVFYRNYDSAGYIIEILKAMK